MHVIQKDATQHIGEKIHRGQETHKKVFKMNEMWDLWVLVHIFSCFGKMWFYFLCTMKGLNKGVCVSKLHFHLCLWWWRKWKYKIKLNESYLFLLAVNHHQICISLSALFTTCGPSVPTRKMFRFGNKVTVGLKLQPVVQTRFTHC